MEEWKEYKLGGITSKIGSGATPKGGKESYLGGDIALIRSQNILDLAFTNSGLVYINKDQASKLNNVEVKENDILLNITGDSVARVCIVPQKILPARVNQHVAIIRGNDIVDNRYLLYYLQYIKPYLLSLSQGGATRNALTKKMLENLDVKVPPKNVQNVIISVLSSLDDKIELNRRINENLEQQAQALFKSWFVDFEPFKDGKFVDSELGMIPEGWRVGVLADIANITMGQSPKGTSYNEIGDGISFYQGRAEFGNRFPSVRLFTTEPSRYAEPYSVLLSVRAPVGDINIAVERCCIGRGLASILSKNKHQSFVLYTMFFLKKELDKFNSEGTVFGSINRSSLENLKIIIPPVDIIDKFENLTSKIDVMLLNLFQETTSLAQLRDTLLPRLMSGELEIKDNSYD